MGSGQCVPTHLAIGGETFWLHRVDLNRSLHVTELSYVVVVATKAGPTEEDIARCLHQALTHNHPLTMVGIFRSPSVPGQRSLVGFLKLQENRRSTVWIHQQGKKAPSPYTADANDLASRVDHDVLLEQWAAVRGKGLHVAGDHARSLLCFWIFMIDQRRVVHDASTTFAIGREPWKSREAGALTNLLHFQRPLEVLCLSLAGYLEYPLHVDAVVPHFEGSKFCQISHAFSIRPDRSGDGIRGLSDVHAETVRRDLHADRQAFEVPLPGSGKRLVKIVNVEVEVSFGRGKDTEVPEVRVATSLDPHADVRSGSKIVCHDGCCAAQKRER